MGYRLNRLDEPIFMALSKPLLTEFGIHHRLESCGQEELPIEKPFLHINFMSLVPEMG